MSVLSFLGHPSLFLGSIHFGSPALWFPPHFSPHFGSPHSPDGVRAPGGPAARPRPGVGRPPPVALPPPPRWDGIPRQRVGSICLPSPLLHSLRSPVSSGEEMRIRNFFEDASCFVYHVLVTLPNIAPDTSDTIIFPSSPLQFYFCSCGRPKRPPPPHPPPGFEVMGRRFQASRP